MEVKLSFYLYQILGVGIIWGGMTYFFDELDQVAVYIYYGMTSWLLFLIVMAVKKFINERGKKRGD